LPGQRTDIDLVGYQHDALASRQVSQKRFGRQRLRLTICMALKKRIERWNFLDWAKAQQLGRLKTTTPLAGNHPVNLDSILPQSLANHLRLIAAFVIEIALSRAVANAKSRRITTARCQRMSHY